MDREPAPSERPVNETRWLTGGLSMVVLLALLSSPTAGWSVAGIESHGRVACGTLAVPVVVVEVATEEPTLWHPCEFAGAFGVGASERVVPTLVREALLSLPPPCVV